MDSAKSKESKNLLLKTWDRCRSLPSKRPTSSKSNLSKSKSWNSVVDTPTKDEKKTKSRRGHQVAPEGCFSVYVGPERQRFAVKAKYASHPLFVMLLEDAEREYGYSSGGPLALPCEVDLFYRVLAEMDGGKDDQVVPTSRFAYGSCSPFRTSSRRLGTGAAYGLLTPSRLLKMNHF